ncbi:MAG: 4Fe-4S binding protein [Candidatus Thermoplasmatota archaeon]|nr:4Fe-4S binding protein [Candidatus Thermoplasmatota archaeon]
MGHTTSRSYLRLQERLDRNPQGAPPSEALFQILQVLFTEREAELVSKLPLRPFTTEDAARIWKCSKEEAFPILDELADKGILFDSEHRDTRVYYLAPTMAGFFEFSLMRTDGRFDRKVLSELYYQYINVEDRFAKNILGITPPIDRVFVHEDMIPDDPELVILDYERASKVIETATCITVGTCYCRHKMEHLGKACDNPQEVCLTFNGAAKTLSKHGIAREISKEEAFEILHMVMELGLVQIGDNVQEGVNWICNCCSCCCEAINAYTRFGHAPKINSNFLAKVEKGCNACGICAKRCPVNAITIEGSKPKGKAVVDPDICIGCGVCARFCPTGASVMERRESTMFVPKDSFERIVLSAIGTGKLQNFLFDNRDLWTHRTLNRFVGFFLKLEPTKRILVQEQIRSSFLNAAAGIQYRRDPALFGGKRPDYSHPEMKSL